MVNGGEHPSAWRGGGATCGGGVGGDGCAGSLEALSLVVLGPRGIDGERRRTPLGLAGGGGGGRGRGGGGHPGPGRGGRRGGRGGGRLGGGGRCGGRGGRRPGG